MDGAVEEVEERTPLFKDGGLVLLLSQLVIDILVGNRPGIITRLYPAGSILKHPLERDAFLRRVGHIGLGQLFVTLILFQKRNHGLHLPS